MKALQYKVHGSTSGTNIMHLQTALTGFADGGGRGGLPVANWQRMAATANRKSAKLRSRCGVSSFRWHDSDLF